MQHTGGAGGSADDYSLPAEPGHVTDTSVSVSACDSVSAMLPAMSDVCALRPCNLPCQVAALLMLHAMPLATCGSTQHQVWCS